MGAETSNDVVVSLDDDEDKKEEEEEEERDTMVHEYLIYVIISKTKG